MPKAKMATTAYSALAAATRILPTTAQTDHLDQLFIDAGYGTRLRRNDWLGNRLGRPVKWLDEMTRTEASKMIDLLKEEIASGVRPESQRRKCEACQGVGMVCSTCNECYRECRKKDKHRYDPVICDECDGKRFED